MSVMVLVVTITGRGDNPTYIISYILLIEIIWIQIPTACTWECTNVSTICSCLALVEAASPLFVSSHAAGRSKAQRHLVSSWLCLEMFLVRNLTTWNCVWVTGIVGIVLDYEAITITNGCFFFWTVRIAWGEHSRQECSACIKTYV